MSEQIHQSPIHVLCRRGVKVAIFRNEANGQTFHKVAVQKIYKDSGGEWKTTTSLGRDDLPIAQLLIGRAWEFILEQEAEPSELGHTHEG